MLATLELDTWPESNRNFAQLDDVGDLVMCNLDQKGMGSL